MSDSHSVDSAQHDTACRRRADRKALPIEIEIETESGTMPAIVRDVSFATNDESTAVGIAVLHHSRLRSDERIECRVPAATQHLPQTFQLELKWSRRFGPEGYLSGGLIFGGSQ